MKKNSRCRICNSKKLVKYLSLGKTPLANDFLKKEDFKKEILFPLEVYFCKNCYLAQLIHVVNKKRLFVQYVYFYSAMPFAPKHFVQYASDVISRFVNDSKKELVIEIGSNDGLLLKAFQEKGCKRVLGVDPAKNITKVAIKNGVPTITDFFTLALANKIVKTHGKAKVIVGNNVVAHINDLHDLVKGVKKTLDDKGVFIFEAPYLIDMFERLAFDSIYHEHLSFFSLLPLVNLFKKYGMEIFDVQVVYRQGYSIRVFVSSTGNYPMSVQVKKLLNKERKMGLENIQTYRELAKRIEKSKNKLNKILIELKKRNLSIAAYGSPARGNTILNYCKIGTEILDFATEELPSKIGLYTPGMHIPVIDIKQARKTPPDYYLLLSWNYKEAILQKEKEFIKNKGKFIIPVQGVKII